MLTVYRERANGRFEYWTYSDGEKVYLSPGFVARQEARGYVNLVELK